MKCATIELQTKKRQFTASIFIDVDAIEYSHRVAAELKALDVPVQTIAEGFVVCNKASKNKRLCYTSCTKNTIVGLSTQTSSFADFVSTWNSIAQEILDSIKSENKDTNKSDELYILRKIVNKAVSLYAKKESPLVPQNVWQFSMRTLNL